MDPKKETIYKKKPKVDSPMKQLQYILCNMTQQRSPPYNNYV